MKNIARVLAALGVCILSQAALAGGPLPLQQAESVAFHQKGFFIYAPAWGNPNGCTRSNAIVLLATGQNYDKAYALLLAAYMAGKKIGGYSDGCASHDGQTYNTIRDFKYLQVSD